MPFRLLVSLLFLTPLSVAHADELTVAVLEFDTSRARDLPESAGPLLGELVTTELSKLRDIKVIDRAFLQELLNEQTRSLQGLSENSSRIQIGELAGARYVIHGRALTFSDKLVVTSHVTSTDSGEIRVVHAEGDPRKSLLTVTHTLASRLQQLLDTFAKDDGLRKERKGIASKPALSRKEMERRVLLHTVERIQGKLSTWAVTASELSYELIARDVEVFEQTESTPSKRLDSPADNDSSPNNADPTIDYLVVVDASTRPERRTGDLVTVIGRVRVTVFDTQDSKEIASHSFESRGVGRQLESAGRNALREAARQSLPALLSVLRGRRDSKNLLLSKSSAYQRSRVSHPILRQINSPEIGQGKGSPTTEQEMDLFIKATKNAFDVMLQVPIEQREDTVTNTSSDSEIASAIIGLQGTSRWSVSIRLTEEVAMSIAKKLLQTKDNLSHDELKDALEKFTNMAAGDAKSELASLRGEDVTLGLPTVILGKNYRIARSVDAQVSEVGFKSPMGNFVLSVSFSN